MLLCLNCYKVYNQKTIKNNMCKVKNCHGDVVEIDELFVPVIIELNRKGYRTRACCSGHYDFNPSNAYSSYLYFRDNIILSSLPDGYMYDQDLYPWVDWGNRKRNTIRFDFDREKLFDGLGKDIISNALKVLEWAEGLDKIEEKEEN